MGVLSSRLAPALPGLLGLLAPACYAPELPDCTTPCSSDLDCAPDQTCGAESYCTAPDVVCAPLERPDAPATPPPPVELRVTVKDGQVEVKLAGQSLAVCDGVESQERTCSLAVRRQVPLSLIATPHAGARFDRWLNGCKGQGATCRLALVAPRTDVRARFRAE